MEAVVVRARSGSLALVRAVPVWAWLTAIVILSATLRFLLARRIVAPWIMVDELIYADLARGFAATGHFLIRGQSTAAYGFVYPLLIAPAFRVFPAMPTAYEAAKAINSVLMSLAAVPSYLLARRVLRPPLALAAALLTIAVPSMAYTSTLMTENAFYPAFVLVALALVLVLELPTWRRQAVLLALCAVAFLIRAQAVAFLPALLTAPLLLAWMDGRRRALRDYRVLWGAALAAIVLVPVVQLARGRSLLGVFGAYERAGQTHYALGSALRWLLYHVAELDLYLGVIPFAALLVLVGLSRRLPRAAQAFVVAAVALSVWLLVEVAAFASKNPVPPRVEERNMFYLAPLFLIALLVWIDAGLPRRHMAVGVAAVIAAALPGVLPYSTLIGVPATSDELALSIWWRLQDNTIALTHVATWAVVASIVAALLFLLVPRRLAALLPAAVAAVFVAVTWTAMDNVHGFRRASIGALFQGDTHPRRDWVDQAVGHDADVAVLFTKCASQRCSKPWSLTDEKVVWENEFFSRSLRRFYYLHDPVPGGLPERQATFHLASGLFTVGRQAIRTAYALLDSSVSPLGSLVAADRRKGIFLWRVDGPLRERTRVGGLYEDTWTGPRVTYLRRGCRGGTLTVVLQSDASLFKRPSLVTARSFGRVVARISVPPGLQRIRVLPIDSRAGRCAMIFDITPTIVPGDGDHRRLGVHMVLAYSRRA